MHACTLTLTDTLDKGVASNEYSKLFFSSTFDAKERVLHYNSTIAASLTIATNFAAHSLDVVNNCSTAVQFYFPSTSVWHYHRVSDDLSLVLQCVLCKK